MITSEKLEISVLKQFINECKNDWEKQPKKTVNVAISSNVSKYMYSLEIYEAKQEKVNELLELYKKERSMLEKYINGNYQPTGEHANILKQIDGLENELNEIQRNGI